MPDIRSARHEARGEISKVEEFLRSLVKDGAETRQQTRRNGRLGPETIYYQ